MSPEEERRLRAAGQHGMPREPRYFSGMHILEKPLETARLAAVALQLIDAKTCPPGALETAFKEALPQAYRLLQLTEQFLEQKEAEKEAAGVRYWASPEGLARLAEFRARYSAKDAKPDAD
jgi:hypothetical protein